MFNPKQPFDLKELPPPISLSTHPNIQTLFTITNEAQRAISELNGLLSNIDNPEILLSSLYLQESVDSSAVENIHTTIESALEDEAKPLKERSEANKEVINYRNALLAGYKSIKTHALSTRTIKTIHKNLDVKIGASGEFRQQQNSITNELPDGSRETIYTPPIFRSINSLLGNWENFANKNKRDEFVSLIKAAICHYQFEAIHPFEDGNGRTGRILMVLQLVQDRLLGYPALFISSYLSLFEKKYKKLLLEVTTKNEWWEFIHFIVIGFGYQASCTQLAITKLDQARFGLMHQLLEDEKNVIKKSNIESVVNHIFSNLTTHSKFMESETSIHWQTCTKYLNHLFEIGVLKQEKRGRYRFYSNELAIKTLRAATTSR